MYGPSTEPMCKDIFSQLFRTGKMTSVHWCCAVGSVDVCASINQCFISTDWQTLQSWPYLVIQTQIFLNLGPLRADIWENVLAKRPPHPQRYIAFFRQTFLNLTSEYMLVKLEIWGWLRCCIAPLPYKVPVKPLYSSLEVF